MKDMNETDLHRREAFADVLLAADRGRDPAWSFETRTFSISSRISKVLESSGRNKRTEEEEQEQGEDLVDHQEGDRLAKHGRKVEREDVGAKSGRAISKMRRRRLKGHHGQRSHLLEKKRPPAFIDLLAVAERS